jgi:hypothetical protein
LSVRAFLGGMTAIDESACKSQAEGKVCEATAARNRK